jgi:hypothetical protein
MKKILTLILIFCSLWVSAQLSNAKINRIQNNFTAFGFNIPKGDIIYDVTAQRWYGVCLALKDTGRITSMTMNVHLKELVNIDQVSNADWPDGSSYWLTSWEGQSTTAPSKNAIHNLVYTYLIRKDQTIPQIIGTTGARLTKIWATDAAVTNAITGSVTGNAGSVTVTDDNSTNSTMYPLWTTAAGQVVPKVSTTKFTFNPSTGTVNASYFIALNFTLTSSDSTLKRQIKPLTPADFEKAAKIEFVKYLRKDDPTNRQHYGVLAQSVEKQFPEMVYTLNGKKVVSYEEVLIMKIAQLEERINQLEKRLK